MKSNLRKELKARYAFDWESVIGASMVGFLLIVTTAITLYPTL